MMKQDNEPNHHPQKQLRLSKWIQEGIDKAASDSIKAILIPIFTIIIIAGLGFIVLINSIYIRIAIDFPAYKVGLGIVIAILIVYANNKTIRKVYKRIRWRNIYGFLWKTNIKDELSGPHCLLCRAHVIEINEGYEAQMQIAYKTIQGVKTLHQFRCANSNCISKPIQLDMDLHTLIQRVQEEYYSTD